ncbi:MAG: TlpA disulfide reductase family protein [Chloroflexota bacterium]|nr:TlpA disulfide reductase family protein [Chloroflexota bacterium]
MTGISVRHSRISWENIRFRWLLIFAAILATAAIACSSNDDSNNDFVSSTGSGDLAPDLTVSMFQGQDVVGGEKVTLSGLIGGRPIVLNFWAGLCPPCRAEMPDLQEFNEDFQDRALLLGVDLGQFTGLGNTDDAKKLLSDLAITYPAGFTSDSDVIRNYQVLGMPTTIFIDREGRIFNRWTGALNKNVLIEKTQEMLDQ